MAGSIEQSIEIIRKNNFTSELDVVEMNWVSHTDGSVSDITTDDAEHLGKTFTEILRGKELLMMQTSPGDPAPTSYTIKVLDESGEDLFGGLSARSATAVESAWPVAGGAYGGRYITGKLELNIAGAGSEKAGKVILHLR